MRTAAGAIGAMAAARAALPYLLTKSANYLLGKFPGYQAHLAGVSLRVLRGRISLRGLTIKQSGADLATPLLQVNEVTITVDWKRLLTEGLVVDVSIESPLASVDAPALTSRPPTASGQNTPTRISDWQQSIRRLFPFQLHAAIRNGEVHIQGLPGQGKTDLWVHDLFLYAKNLTNSSRFSSSLMGQIECYARVMSDGRMTLRAEGDPLSTEPTFDANFKLEGLRLPELTSFAQKFAGIDIESGLLDAYFETAAKDGRIRGYVQPVIERLQVRGIPHDGLASKLKAAVAQWAAHLLKNRKDDRITTRADFGGSFADPDFDVARAIGLALKNAFFKAIRTHFENRIWMQDVKVQPVTGLK